MVVQRTLRPRMSKKARNALMGAALMGSVLLTKVRRTRSEAQILEGHGFTRAAEESRRAFNAIMNPPARVTVSSRSTVSDVTSEAIMEAAARRFERMLGKPVFGF